MKRRVVACVFWLAAGIVVPLADTAKADDVPFFASRDVPDYEASMVVREWWGQVITFPRSVLHHQGWTKVEEVRPAVTTISYGNYLDNDLILWIDKGDDQEDFGVAIILKFTPPEVRETGDVAIQSGEVCKWWELVQTVQEEGVKQPPWRSCLSSDGIEVGTKELFSEIPDANGTELVKLERRPVAESEVRPPKRIFEPAFWLKPLRDYPDRPADRVDFEAKMRMVGGQSEIRLLRHYPWRLEERRGSGGLVQFKLWNELEDQGIAISTSDDQYRFEARRSPRAPAYPYTNFDKTMARIDLKRNEAHLGETCTWFELTSDLLNPVVKNVGKTECLTPDGVPLKFTGLDSTGAFEGYTAVEVRRRPVDLKEMLPPSELMEPSTWGFTVGD